MANFFQALAQAIVARRNCLERADNPTNDARERDRSGAQADRWLDYINHLVKEHAPSGAGFDNGTVLDLDNSSDARLRFSTSYHHATEHGFYDGWTDHDVTVKPRFSGVDIVVGGRNRNDIKSYIAETFHVLASVEPIAFGDWLTKNAGWKGAAK